MTIIKCGNINTELRLEWHITNWCNYKCSYCTVLNNITNDFTKDANNRNYNFVISRLKLIDKPWSICLTGGETTLHPKLFDILDKLIEIPLLNKVWVFTNLSRSIDFYRKLTQFKSNKIVLYASYHPEYYNDNFVEKCKMLHKEMNFTIHLSLSDNPLTWDMTESVIEELRSNNIECRPNLLSPTQNWTPNYNDEFYKRFYSYLESEDEEVNNIQVEFADKKIFMRDYDMTIQNVNNFYGYTCYPGSYQIDITGNIRNTCTNKNIPLYTRGNNLLSKEICPKRTCNKALLNFYKERNEI